MQCYASKSASDHGGLSPTHLAHTHGDSGYLPRRPRISDAVFASGRAGGESPLATARATDGDARHAGRGESTQHLDR